MLVILAILAAIMIPALTGYIDKANKKKSVVEARCYLLAMQTVASECYPDSIVDNKALKTTAVNGVTPSTEVATLADVDGTISEVVITASKVESFKYTTQDTKHEVEYKNKKFTVVK